MHLKQMPFGHCSAPHCARIGDQKKMPEMVNKANNSVVSPFLPMVLFLSAVLSFALPLNIYAQDLRDGKASHGRVEKTTAADLIRPVQVEASQINNKTYYAVTEELPCGDIRVQAITVCTDMGDCISQKIYFIDNHNRRRLIKDVMAGKAYNWSCARDGRQKAVLFIGYGNLGSCVFCEWNEVFDLGGNLLLNSYFAPYFSAGGITSQWGECAAVYINYSSGFRRDEQLLNDACGELSAPELKEMKARIKQWHGEKNKIANLIYRSGDQFVAMQHVKIIRERNEQNKQRQHKNTDRIR